jgi:hypothetical protein
MIAVGVVDHVFPGNPRFGRLPATSSVEYVINKGVAA